MVKMIITLTVFTAMILAIGLIVIPYMEKDEKTSFREAVNIKIICLQLLKIMEVAGISLLVGFFLIDGLIH